MVKYVITDYNMAFSISALISSVDPYQPSAIALGWYGSLGRIPGWYGKGCVVIYIYKYIVRPFICEGRVGILLTCGKHLHDHFIYTRQIVFWIRFVKWVECIWFVSQNLGGHIYTSQRSCTLSEDTILGSISIF